MKITIKRYNIFDIDLSLRKDLQLLSFYPYGKMMDAYLDRSCTKKAVFVATNDNGKVVGWCLRFKSQESYYAKQLSKDNPWIVYFFVSRSHRQRGIATLLMKRALKGLSTTVAVQPWDESSQHFFDSVSYSKLKYIKENL